MQSTTNIVFAVLVVLALPWCLFGALAAADETGPIPIQPQPDTAAEDTLERVTLEPRRTPGSSRIQETETSSDAALAALGLR